MTFDKAAEAYLQKFEDSWKNPAHRRQWRMTLRDYISPVLGKLDVATIDTDAVLRVLEPIWSKIPETAGRVRGRIEKVLDFAGRNGSNPARWKGHLEHKLAKRNKARSVKKLAALPYTEVGALMAALRDVDHIAARALELTIFCATRSNTRRALDRVRSQGAALDDPSRALQASRRTGRWKPLHSAERSGDGGAGAHG
jgi:hypothetical protein